MIGLRNAQTTDPPIRTMPVGIGQLDVGNTCFLWNQAMLGRLDERSLYDNLRYSPSVLGCSHHGFRPRFQHRLVRTIKTGSSLDFSLFLCTRPQSNTTYIV